MADFESFDAESSLQEWYGRLSARRVDLVGDYAGKELFLLEGDSLLLHCFSGSKLDFVDGFQVLHAVYAVEYFLLGLAQRHCNFHIVFFETHRDCCVPRGVEDVKRSRFLLARSVIRRHLLVNLEQSHPSIKVQTFTSVWDEAFQKYLIATGVYFVMCHDGAAPSSMPTNTDSSKRRGERRTSVIETQEASRKKRFRAMIYNLMKRGYNIALINGLEFVDTKVMTMVVEGSRNASFQYNPNPEDVASPSDSKHDRELSSIVYLLSTLGLRHSPHGTTETENNEPQKQSSMCQFPSTEKQKCQCVGSPVACCSGLTERVILTILVLGRMLEGKLVAESLAGSFLAHAVLIGSTPLPKRRLRPSSQHDYEKSPMNVFLADFARLSNTLLSENAWTEWMSTNNVVCDISDLVDGRLCEAVFADPINSTLDTQQISTFEKFAHALCAVSGFHLKPLSSAPATKMSSQSINGSIANEMTILPFTNPVFDKHLTSINIRTAPSKASERQSGRIYQEVTHWHNARRRLDPKATLQTPATEKEKKRGLRRNQFFMAEMQAYAASLTNAAGKALEPEILTVSGGTYPESLKDTKAAKPAADKAQKTKATPNRKKAMLDDIAANKAIKDNQTDEKIFSAWRTVRKNLDAERSLQSKYLKIQAYLRDLSEAKRSVLQCEVELHLLCILVEMYSILRKESESKPAASLREEILGIAALIWDTSRRLASMGGLTKTIARILEDIVKMLGLPDPGIPRVQSERKLAYDPALLLPRGSELVIHLGNIEFQLLHCGPYMDRNLDSAPDSRVPFHPDAWQRRVLDELDAKNSVFVVAPTSAGKTFISFYAMEKILRADDDSVLVYVAPTKALVNQIAAEIQARFRKTYKFAGKSVWAIHTRDYRINNPSGCQILVTVPHILQIMLLAPSNAKSWSPRVKYIIFDEIHSIGQAEDGVVWEQLLLLAPCPIIALSATVGNPEMFNSWLSSTQQSSGHEVTMIKHQHRYSDLRKFVFNPPNRFAFFGLADRPSFATLGLGGLEGLAFVHPIASLVNKSRGMPDDLSLEARDCLSLYQAMKKHETPEFPVDATLSPSNYNVLPSVIRKAHIIEWEQKLKTLLKKWMTSEQSPFDKVLEDLSQSIEVSSSPDKQVSKGEIAEVEDDDFVDVDAGDLYATTLPLLCKLHERNALPAILFNYDRHRCEGIALNLLKQLEDAESRWKNTSPAWKAKLQNFEDYKKNQAKAGAKKPVKAAAKKKGKEDDDDGGSRMDRIQDAASEEANPYANFDPAAPVDGFHFAAKQKAQASELSEYFYQMTRRGVSPWLTLALRRGIGVHHAGMNRKYRQVVEMLFRKGYLRVVIATGTLALGINMPCATVVFSGDSIFLTALNFRQAAGRAGRRGFDLLGNVVFQNISHGKVCRLLSSRLPDLNGHFPVTTTLVLRLFSLLNESGDSPYAVKAINSLLSQPRLYLDGPAFKDQVLHHLRFSIEYLRRQDLLSAQGTPINFAGLTSHLYFTENSSFALNALIKGEYFHQLCSEIDTKESHVLRTLMIVMAHLFGRRPCREADAEYVENVVKRSSSIVFLPPLPVEAAGILRKHNEDTLMVFTTYVRTFVDQHIKTDDDKLPLTGIKAGGTDDSVTLPGSLPPVKVRSSFVALSGHGDTFESISDLCRTTRSGVFLEEAVIPHLDIYPDESTTPLNAYLYDFYMHGDLDTLEKANGVRKSDVWFLLNDFSLVLATITASLANFLKLPESDLSLTEITGEGDEHENLEDDKFAADSTDTESTATSTATVDTGRTSIMSGSSAGLRAKTKKKAKDSWDDSEDDEDDGQATNGAPEEDRSKEELERGFLNVYKAMKRLRLEFDTKFRKIFA